MKKQPASINNPDELSQNLRYNSPITWLVLSAVIFLLVGFFVWSSLYKLKVKVSGIAEIDSGSVTLRLEQSELSQLKEGQKVYIANLEGEILSFVDNKPVISTFALADGEYDYYIVIKEMKPIDFLFRN